MDWRAPRPLASVIRRMLDVRRQHPSLLRGHSLIVAADDSLFAYLRVTPDSDEVTIITVNTGSKARVVQLPGGVGDPVEAQPGTTALAWRNVTLERAAELASLARDPGRRELRITVEAPACPSRQGRQLVIAGSPRELGAWSLSAASAIREGEPTPITVPAGGVHALKLVMREGLSKGTWSEGQDTLVHVPPGKDPLPLTLTWRGPSPCPR
jgi:hypothetical protein